MPIEDDIVTPVFVRGYGNWIWIPDELFKKLRPEDFVFPKTVLPDTLVDRGVPIPMLVSKGVSYDHFQNPDYQSEAFRIKYGRDLSR